MRLPIFSASLLFFEIKSNIAIGSNPSAANKEMFLLSFKTYTIKIHSTKKAVSRDTKMFIYGKFIMILKIIPTANISIILKLFRIR